MSVGSISAAGLSQYVLSAGNSTQQQALQALQNNLAAGDLDSAQSAFQNLQSVLQNSATTSGVAQRTTLNSIPILRRWAAPLVRETFRRRSQRLRRCWAI
jgi:hypothetical protein